MYTLRLRCLGRFAQRRMLFSCRGRTVQPHIPPAAASALPAVVPRRSMVMVTKTKASDPPLEKSVPSTAISESPVPSEAGAADLIITDACWKQILRLAERKKVPPTEMFLRLYVDAGGCSGFEYKFEVETDGAALEEDDLVWEGPEGVRVVVDEGSLAFVKGATLDYVVEMIKSAFTVKENPQSESACGCGSSFAVKNFSSNPALD